MISKKQYILAITIIVLVGVVAVLPRYVEQRHNRVTAGPLPEITAAAKRLHKSLLVADLHADSLLWDRDLASSSTYGHLDLPRMRRGGAALQVFSIVSKTPHGLNLHENADDSDDITWLAMAQRWPLKTWFSLHERVYYMSSRLTALAADPDKQFMLIRNQGDLAEFLSRRQQQPEMLAGLLSIEGAHALEGSLDLIDAFYARGIRLVGLTHFFDNEVGGSAHGERKGGLTPFGKQAIARMQSLGMLIDLAHSSEKLFADVVSISRYPLIVSHTGVAGTCNKSRNLSDTQLRQIAATGGVIGIGYWPSATCGSDVESIVRAIDYAVKVAGIDAVSLGSDFDGSVSTPIDVTGLPYLTDALLRHGFSEVEVSKIMGGNFFRLLGTALPAA
ncbi:dipeptidase [Sulfuriflexus mobilis]|uniref:dipeptidase n=1 Tax=Sulfuriflexus mobilis TaxID=1811807 RepID=UPI000F826B6A|nr:dipeptidase [Sulfuriflexus mobilis]